MGEVSEKDEQECTAATAFAQTKPWRDEAHQKKIWSIDVIAS